MYITRDGNSSYFESRVSLGSVENEIWDYRLVDLSRKELDLLEMILVGTMRTTIDKILEQKYRYEVKDTWIPDYDCEYLLT